MSTQLWVPIAPLTAVSNPILSWLSSSLMSTWQKMIWCWCSRWKCSFVIWVLNWNWRLIRIQSEMWMSSTWPICKNRFRNLTEKQKGLVVPHCVSLLPSPSTQISGPIHFIQSTHCFCHMLGRMGVMGLMHRKSTVFLQPLLKKTKFAAGARATIIQG